MKIYVVTKGEYSDYRIITATLNRWKAESIAEKFADLDEDTRIEEYEDEEQ